MHVSAIGPKRTSLVAPHMSAFGGKADMTACGKSLSRSLSGVKRTCLFALHMSAYDPKRTSLASKIAPFGSPVWIVTMPRLDRNRTCIDASSSPWSVAVAAWPMVRTDLKEFHETEIDCRDADDCRWAQLCAGPADSCDQGRSVECF